MKRLTPYSWLILIIFSSCLTGNKVASTDKQIESLSDSPQTHLIFLVY